MSFTNCGIFLVFVILLTVSAEISPQSGPITGGTVVSIGGQNFFRSHLLRCSFGDVTDVYATYVNESTLLCISPPHAAGNVSVEVSVNAQDYTNDGIQFSFQSMFIK